MSRIGCCDGRVGKLAPRNLFISHECVNALVHETSITLPSFNFCSILLRGVDSRDESVAETASRGLWEPDGL